MKKKMLLLILFLAGSLCLTACSSNSENLKTSDTKNQAEQNISEEKEYNKEEPAIEQEESDVEENDTADQSLMDDSAVITIYYSNDDATAFDSEEIQLDSRSPEAILEALVDKGMMAADAQILSFETTAVDGKATIEIDFNNEFSSYVSSMGSTGEYYVMGSVCNTFLDAYDCEQIRITVEGQTLSTGHAEYPGYMTVFSQ